MPCLLVSISSHRCVCLMDGADKVFDTTGERRPIRNSSQIILTAEMIMEIRDIIAVVGIFHQLL